MKFLFTVVASMIGVSVFATDLRDMKNSNMESKISQERDFSEVYLNTSPNKPVILDVDMCTDVDDLCAVRVATRLDDLGIIDLKALVIIYLL